MPNKISKESALDKIHDLIKLLQGHSPHHPVAESHDETMSALGKLQEVFTSKTSTTKNTNVQSIKTACPKLLRVNITNAAKPPRVSILQNSNTNKNHEHR